MLRQQWRRRRCDRRAGHACSLLLRSDSYIHIPLYLGRIIHISNGNQQQQQKQKQQRKQEQEQEQNGGGETGALAADGVEARMSQPLAHTCTASYLV